MTIVTGVRQEAGLGPADPRQRVLPGQPMSLYRRGTDGARSLRLASLGLLAGAAAAMVVARRRRRG